MSTTVVGVFVGAVLALTWIAFGFWSFVLVAAAMVAGAFVGLLIEGRVDFRTLANAFRRGRSSP